MSTKLDSVIVLSAPQWKRLREMCTEVMLSARSGTDIPRTDMCIWKELQACCDDVDLQLSEPELRGQP